jgi:hypothetical protein
MTSMDLDSDARMPVFRRVSEPIELPATYREEEYISEMEKGLAERGEMSMSRVYQFWLLVFKSEARTRNVRYVETYQRVCRTVKRTVYVE